MIFLYKIIKKTLLSSQICFALIDVTMIQEIDNSGTRIKQRR